MPKENAVPREKLHSAGCRYTARMGTKANWQRGDFDSCNASTLWYPSRMGKKRPGRPKLARGKAKQAAIIVRLLPAERRACDRAAKASGQKLSAWTRDALLTAVAS
jgi:hypothetical protein